LVYSLEIFQVLHAAWKFCARSAKVEDSVRRQKEQPKESSNRHLALSTMATHAPQNSKTSGLCDSSTMLQTLLIKGNDSLLQE
jgi:hypothetical protein